MGIYGDGDGRGAGPCDTPGRESQGAAQTGPFAFCAAQGETITEAPGHRACERSATFMDVYFLRHGLAADPGGPGAKSDSERALTGEGKRKLRQIAHAIREMEISF